MHTDCNCSGSGGGSGGDTIINFQTAFEVGAGRNHPQSQNQWLRDRDGVPTNISPIIFDRDVKLSGLAVEARLPATFTIEVYDRAIAKAGGVPNVANAIAVLTVTANASGRQNGLVLNLLGGDAVGVYCRSIEQVRNVSAHLYLEQR